MIVVLPVPAIVSKFAPLATEFTTVKRFPELFAQACAPPSVIGTGFVASPIVTAPAPELIVIPPVPMENARDVVESDLMVVVPVFAKVMPAIEVSAPNWMVSLPFTPVPLKNAESADVGAEPDGDPVAVVHQFPDVPHNPVMVVSHQ